ncbi:hypothetical protein FNF31_01500 [Cafeteria roenbergensis]|uniref:Importin N-terminal domain-containing protein n=2 Tax=Cafeteria roenbergensis TaxID=33653 RepID=A0A5A8DRT6_CAFRO|nr:hypothetical protein FNF31_01500 [Cafeteria roenbergensis]KAA0168152.1 hypothetical protein FNF28_02571 [Cafeteria roenbergensis]
MSAATAAAATGGGGQEFRDLADVEATCDAMYDTTLPEPTRKAAEMRLVPLAEQRETVPMLQTMLEHSSHTTCQMVAVVSLTRVTQKHWTSFPDQSRITMRDAILNILARRGPSMEPGVVVSACRLVATITKLGWTSTDERFRDVVAQAAKLLDSALPLVVVGVRLLSELVSEINARADTRTFNAHRRVAVSFRDLSLRRVFEFGMATLFQVATRKLRHDDNMSPAEATRLEASLLDQTLLLLRRCLEFDFIGTRPDETSDELGSIQVPSTWRDLVQSPATVRLLFALHRGLTTGVMPDPMSAAGGGARGAPPTTPVSGAMGSSASGGSGGGAAAVAAAAGAGQAITPSPLLASRTLQLLNLWASVRRSLFASDAARRSFLGELVVGCTAIMRDRLGLSHEDCFLHFCRLLGRLKSNYQLAELVRSANYTEWVLLSADLARTAFANPDYSPASLQYILGLWSKLVAAVPHLMRGGGAGRASGGGGSLAGSTGDSGSGSGSGGGSGGGSDDAPSAADVELERLGPEVVAAYVQARVKFSGVTGGAEGISADALQLHDECEAEVLAIPGLFRFGYDRTAAGLMAVWDSVFGTHRALAAGAVGGAAGVAAAGTDPAAADAASAAVAAAGGDVALALRGSECQLAWLVYILAATVSGQSFGLSATGCTDETVRLDAELIRRVLQLLDLTDQRVTAAAAAPGTASRLARCDPRLEHALLFFIQRIQTSFLSEAHGMPSPQKLTGSAQRGKAGGGSGASAEHGTFLVPEANVVEETAFAAGGGGSLGVSFAAGGGGGIPAASLISRLSGTTGLAASIEAGGTSKLLGGMSASGMFASKAVSGKQARFLELWRLVGRGDHTEVVATLINHMATGLRFWGDVHTVINRTLEVLEGMAFSYSAGRLLNSLESVSYLLKNHGPESFPFLALQGNGRARTRFYMCLARLLFLGEDADERFDAFFAPIAATMDAARAPGAAAARTSAVGAGLSGLGRDLRGIVRAAHNKSTFNLVFDSIIASGRIEAVVNGIASWSDVPAVCNPLLKAVVEMTTNRGSRIGFPSSSPNGVLLFKTVSQAVVAYAKPVLSTPIPETDAYAARFKGTSQAIRALTLALSGTFCPIGVFDLYKDPTLDHALEGGLRLFQSIPHASVHSHPKVAREAFSFLAVLFHSHLDKLVQLPLESFQSLLAHLNAGVNSIDDRVASSAAAAIDNLCTAFVRGQHRTRKDTAGLRRQLAAQPTLFEDVMQLLFKIVVFSEASLWTVARPLLSSTLAACVVKPAAWSDFSSAMVGSQPPEVRPRFKADLDKLMTGITRSLDAPNRERFTRAVHLFRAEVLTYVQM